MSNLPTIQDCFNILEKNKVPTHIVSHSEMVARVGLVLTDALNKKKGLGLHLDLVVTACLLHDVKKMECIEKGCDHAYAAYEYLLGLGMKDVAEIVRQHYRLDAENKDFTQLNPVHICFYADNRVRHHEIVTVEERFKDIMERYGRDEVSIMEIKNRLYETLRLEEVLFDGLDFGPGAIENKVNSVTIFGDLIKS